MKRSGKFTFTLVGQEGDLKLNLVNTVSRIKAQRLADLAMRPEGADYSVPDISSPKQTIPGSDISGNEDLSPKEFMAQRNPKTDMQRIACLGYYLTHFRKTPHFKTRDLTHLNIEAAQPQLSNPAAAVRNAAAHRYLSPAGSGQKMITHVGEAVVRALPDLDKVKEELARHKPARKKYQRRKIKK
jgi:hypothetical protein